jgi:ubiquitin-protein ligase E3 C
MPSPQPIESKSSPALPHLVDLIKNALSLPVSPSYRTSVIEEILFFLLTIPLLPYRLPLKSLSVLSATLPFPDLHLLSPPFIPHLVEALDIDSRVHLLANLASFVPPRYSQLQKDDIILYLHLLAGLLNSLPVSALDPQSVLAQDRPSSPAQDDSDDSEASHAPSQVSSVPVVPHSTTVDVRTLKRVHTLPDPAHVSTLLDLGKTHPSIQLELIMLLLALNAVWSAKKDDVLAAAGIYANGGGLVRELYRGYVRNSPRGRDDNPGAILGKLLDSFRVWGWHQSSYC